MCTRQRTGVRKATHGCAQGSAPAVHRRVQVVQGSALEGQGLRSYCVQATSRQCIPAKRTLANDYMAWTKMGCLKRPTRTSMGKVPCAQH